MSEVPVMASETQPMKRRRQFGIAAALGASAAALAVALPAGLTFDLIMVGRFLPYALLIALPLGALAGVLCLATGLLIRRLLSRVVSDPKVAAIGGSVAMFALGAGLAGLIFFGPARDLWPFVFLPVLAVAVGSVGLYVQAPTVRSGAE